MKEDLNKKVILSGLKPSGEIHIGNYLGAIQQWVDLQGKYPSYFFIADLHAITEPQQPKDLRRQILETAAAYLALGVDHKKTVFFVQSHVPEHTQLMWILNTITSMGDLERMVAYKEKVAEGKETLAGLFTYPVLMAADILLYKPTHVPVGGDQRQHVELTRELARRFNTRFGDVFPLPKEFLDENGTRKRIMSLQDPAKKMSKSHGTQTYIGVFDPPEVIRKKIKSAVTDSGTEVIYQLEKSPAISNLISIYQFFSQKAFGQIEYEFVNKGYGEFKTALADLLVEKLAPIQDKHRELLKNRDQLLTILKDGAERARAVASKTLAEVYEKVGLNLNK